MSVTVKITGIRECEAALDEMPTATARNVLRRALSNAAKPVEATAKAHAPVNQGVLKADITTATQLTKRQRRKQPRHKATTVYVGVGGKRASVSHLPEYGTSHSAPQPYMRPAFDANAGRVIEAFKIELRSEIEKAKARARRKAARTLAKG